MSIQIYGSTQHEMYENWYLMNIDKTTVTLLSVYLQVTLLSVRLR